MLLGKYLTEPLQPAPVSAKKSNFSSIYSPTLALVLLCENLTTDIAVTTKQEMKEEVGAVTVLRSVTHKTVVCGISCVRLFLYTNALSPSHIHTLSLTLSATSRTKREREYVYDHKIGTVKERERKGERERERET